MRISSGNIHYLCALAVVMPVLLGQETQTTQPPQTPAPAPASKPAPAPPPPAVENPYETADGVPSLLLYYMRNPQSDVFLHSGKKAIIGANPAELKYPGDNKGVYGGILSFPAGENSSLRVSYFRTQGAGTVKTTQPLFMFGSSYKTGDILAAGYTLQNIKASYEYLSWPFPLKDSRFRLKTLYEVQYISMKSGLSAAELDSAGVFPVDAKGSNNLIFPSLGIAVLYSFSKQVRWEARGSGFWLPHRANLGDAESSLNVKLGKIELAIGGKYFHFRTSPQKESFNSVTLPGAFVGIRWYPFQR